MKSFDNGILVGEIVNVCADESVLTDGKIDPKKLKPIAFDPVNNTYLAMGDQSRRRIRFRKSPEINTDDDMTANM